MSDHPIAVPCPHPDELAAYPGRIDAPSDPDRPLPAPATDLGDIRAFADRTGFFRTRDDGEGSDDPRFDGWVAPDPVGPPWTDAESDHHAHDFLDRLASGRPTDRYDDPLEHARENGLLLLFGRAAQARFEHLLRRMTPGRADAWRELLAGGASSEAFGPLTLEEQLDEQQVTDALARGRRQQIVNLALGAAVVIALAVAAVVVWPDGEGERASGTISFTDVTETAEEISLDGPPPAVDATLSTAIGTPIVVAAGPGSATDRIVVDIDVEALPRPPGDVVATLFQYAGRGRLVLVGGPGWYDGLCTQVSVTSAGLRPFDTAHYPDGGPCEGELGRLAEATCVSDTTMVLDLEVPSGEITLTEGGTATADSVRVQLDRPDPAYEELSVRGVISVDAGENAAVPRFGGQPGDPLTFDFTPAGQPSRIGSCAVGVVDGTAVTAG